MDPDKRDYNIQGEPQTDIEYLKKYVARHLPGLETEPSIVETCMYTVSALVVDWLFIRLSTYLPVCLSVFCFVRLVKYVLFGYFSFEKKEIHYTGFFIFFPYFLSLLLHVKIFMTTILNSRCFCNKMPSTAGRNQDYFHPHLINCCFQNSSVML